jgi:SAM-dependent methyltransferase
MDYYGHHYRAYYDASKGIDPEPFLGPFVRHLSPGDRVLDVGCGSGRDLRWLQRRGMRATGFERSPGLARLARRHAGCGIVEGDFDTYDFSSIGADAILLCGSLVHVPHNRLAATLERILRALDPGSRRRIVYLSLKEGHGTAADASGRVFFFWQDDALKSIFAACALRCLDFQRSLAADGRGRIWLGYVLSHRQARLEKDRQSPRSIFAAKVV